MSSNIDMVNMPPPLGSGSAEATPGAVKVPKPASDNPTTERSSEAGPSLKFEHTAGPWIPSRRDCGDGNIVFTVFDSKGRLIADVPRFGNDNERNGITRLIAAAPDLLSAARNAIIPLEWARDHIDPMFSKKVQANIDAINAAIAKATGAAP